MKPENTSWQVMLASALGLGLTPSQFWRLSLKEWRALVAPTADQLTRAAFEQLAQRFPDEPR